MYHKTWMRIFTSKITKYMVISKQNVPQNLDENIYIKDFDGCM